MIAHPTEAVLNDWADGTLPPGRRAEVERHLEVCAECRGSAHALASLVRELAGLPHEIEPPSDARVAIARRIAAAEAPSRVAWRERWGGRTLHSARMPLAAAAIVLVALSSAITVWIVGRTTGDAMLAGPSPEFIAAEAKYRQATDELESLLRAARTQLSPETARLLEQNLAVINAALAEARAALGKDPGNTVLTEIILASYEKKLELLRRAASSEI
jgi:anti-sigma factor ChrR (cupin superfamily)